MRSMQRFLLSPRLGTIFHRAKAEVMIPTFGHINSTCIRTCKTLQPLPTSERSTCNHVQGFCQSCLGAKTNFMKSVVSIGLPPTSPNNLYPVAKCVHYHCLCRHGSSQPLTIHVQLKPCFHPHCSPGFSLFFRAEQMYACTAGVI